MCLSLRGLANGSRHRAQPGQRATQAASPPSTQQLPHSSWHCLPAWKDVLQPCQCDPTQSHVAESQHAGPTRDAQLHDAPRPQHLPMSLLLSPSCRHAAFPIHTWHGKAAKLLSPCQGVLVGTGTRATSPGISAGDLDIPRNRAWYWHLAHCPTYRQTQQDKLMRRRTAARRMAFTVPAQLPQHINTRFQAAGGAPTGDGSAMARLGRSESHASVPLQSTSLR